MSYKRTLLENPGRDDLKALVQQLEVSDIDRRSGASMVESIMKARRFRPVELLPLLSGSRSRSSSARLKKPRPGCTDTWRGWGFRDDPGGATASHPSVLANLESMNAELIHMGLPQHTRLQRLNEIAIRQMQIVTTAPGVGRLAPGEDKG